MSQDRLAYLFNRYFYKTATQEERQELMALLQDEANEEQLKTLMSKAWNKMNAESVVFNMKQSDAMLEEILNVERKTAKVYSIRAHTKKLNWKMVSVAASIIVFISAGVLLWLNKNSNNAISKTNESTQTVHSNDIVPGSNKAQLTLANGTTVILDNSKKGNIAQQGNTAIVKLNGNTLTYNADKDNSTEILYNTIATPRGGQYQVALPDGTNVWLNASSSLHFPTVFKGKERKVMLTGEAYFEVAHNMAMPFKVEIVSGSDVGKPTEIEVLGTHFNVMAYNDEHFQNTTLLEGSVKIISGQESSLLKYGQQAKVKAGEAINISQADTEQAIAWKNGEFIFNGDDMEKIMRQVSRWYDVDVVYDSKMPASHFSGIVSRNNNLSQVLKIMEAGGVNFKITGKTIHVL